MDIHECIINSAYKLDFLADAFLREQKTEMTEDSQYGMALILKEIKSALLKAADKLT